MQHRRIIGIGESLRSSGKFVHRLNAVERNGIWRFEITSRKETDPPHGSSEDRSYGLLKFVEDGSSALVLEYRSDNSIANYRVEQES